MLQLLTANGRAIDYQMTGSWLAWRQSRGGDRSDFGS